MSLGMGKHTQEKILLQFMRGFPLNKQLRRARVLFRIPLGYDLCSALFRWSPLTCDSLWQTFTRAFYILNV